MSELLQIKSDIDTVLKKLEVFLRSSQSKADPQEIQELVGYAYRIFDYFHNVVVNKKEEVRVDNNQDYVELAVKLHNKVRNMTVPSLSIAKNLLRACAAWMFILFGDKTSKILSIIIKLLSKSGEDLCRCEETKAYGLHCFNACIILWKSSGDVNLYDQLPALDLQDTKFCVFKSLQGVIMNSNIATMDISDIKQVASFGLELAESLDDRFQLSLVDTLFKIGHQLTNQDNNKNDALYFLNLAINILRKPIFIQILQEEDERYGDSSDGEGTIVRGGVGQVATDSGDIDKDAERSRTSLVRTYLDLRVRVYLALIYLYANMDEITKAIACITAIEEVEHFQQRFLNESLYNTVTFSKLLVASKSGDIVKTEHAVKMLLQHPDTPFKTSLSGVKTLQEMLKDGGREKMSEYYKMLASKYPSDPDFTTIRIAHLQATITNLKATKDDEHQETRARDISTRIVSDHLHQLHVLTEDNFKLFRIILCDQLNWYKSLNMWAYVKSWGDVLLPLIDTLPEEHNLVSVVYALKVEALMHLHQSADAVDTAQRLIAREVTLRSLTTLFKALLFSEELSAEGIISRLIAIHQKPTPLHSTTSDMPMITTEEKLQNLIMCAYITQRFYDINQETYLPVPDSKKYELLNRLLQEWMKLYTDEQYWRHISIAAINRTTTGTTTVSHKKDQHKDKDKDKSDESKEMSYMEILTEYISHITLHLTEELFAQASASGVIVPSSSLKEELEEVKTFFAQSIRDAIKQANEPTDKCPNCFKLLKDLALLQPLSSMKMIMSYVKHDLLPYIDMLLVNIHRIQSDSQLTTMTSELLGEKRLILNIADICFQFCQLIVEVKDRCIAVVTHTTVLPGMDYLTWCKLTDCSEVLYDRINESSSKTRLSCLVLSTIAYIEAFDDFTNTNTSNSGNITGNIAVSSSGGVDDPLMTGMISSTPIASSSQKRTHKHTLSPTAKALIEEATKRLNEARYQQRGMMDFGGKEDQQIRTVIFMLYVSTFTREHSIKESEDFITSNSAEIMVLDDEHMREFIDLISQENKFSVEAIRKALEYCVQSLSCRTSPPSLLGWVYRKLVDLSPSRKYACAKIEDLVAAVRACKDGNCFDVDDMDSVVARAYNSSLMLIDLDQLSLAEQFAEYGLTLAAYGSEETKSHIPTMQDTLNFIREQKSRGNQGAVKLSGAIIETSANSGKEDILMQTTPDHGKVGPLNAELFIKPAE